jgi:hypothetical protein
MKQVIKSFIGLYSNWEVISLLNLYNKKKNKINFTFFFKFNNILKYFKLLLNYFCNFFLFLDAFFLDFFFFTGYNNNIFNRLLDNIWIYNCFNNYKLNNNIFNRFINNYYSMDFFTKNSKIMSYCSLKTFIVYK